MQKFWNRLVIVLGVVSALITLLYILPIDLDRKNQLAFVLIAIIFLGWGFFEYIEITTNNKIRIFINYDEDFSNNLLAQIEKALKHKGYIVNLLYSNETAWLQHTEYLIIMLTPKLSLSSTITENIQFAKTIRAAILPILINLPPGASVSADLYDELKDYQPWRWNSSDDTKFLINGLLKTIKAKSSLLTNHTLLTSWESLYRSYELKDNPPRSVSPIELPKGQMSIDSIFYIERPPIEERCYNEILKPGSLIRIQAPRQMGKSSLMSRIIHEAEKANSKTAILSFQFAANDNFTDINKFSRWLCYSITDKLEMPLKDNYIWRDSLDGITNCKNYFEKYLLKKISTSLTLGLDEVDRVFEYPQIYRDFFGFLRAAHEAAKTNDIWKKLHLIIVHSTEVYVDMPLYESPFNVGETIDLPNFNIKQVHLLAKYHKLNWNSQQIERLINIVGGHPFLIRLTMYEAVIQGIALDSILKIAATENGIYISHLNRLWRYLDKHSELKAAMKKVVSVSDQKEVSLETKVAFQLKGMGLVNLVGETVKPSCELYKLYFQKLFGVGNEQVR